MLIYGAGFWSVCHQCFVIHFAASNCLVWHVSILLCWYCAVYIGYPEPARQSVGQMD